MKKNFWKKISGLLLACVMTLATAVSLVACGGNDSSQSSSGPVDFTTMTYVAFGDSITWGEDGATHEQMQKPYPILVAQSLGLSPNGVTNCGKRGATVTFSSTNRYLMELVQEAPARADIVSVMIGVNDFAGSQALGTSSDTGYGTIYGSLNNLTVQLKTKYPNAFIFFMTPLNQYKNAAVNSAGYQLSDVANAVKEVCAASQIPVLDTYQEVEFSRGTDADSDGLHPTSSFVENYLAPKITQFIQDNFS